MDAAAPQALEPPPVQRFGFLVPEEPWPSKVLTLYQPPKPSVEVPEYPPRPKRRTFAASMDAPIGNIPKV
jgi:hypothetical protein